jgi:hydrogenase expression/formation protein HypE
VNDLAMKGAVPLALSVAAVIEEGFDLALLADITRSMAAAAKEAKVNIVTGDTKVVEKGKADRLFITTSGIGLIPKGISISGKNACPGDAVLINGTIADHGTAVLLARNDFKLSARIESDCAPLNGLVRRLLATTKTVHVLRDPTRGGVATTLNEIAAASGAGIIIEEKLMPVKPEVRAACNILGLDPLYVANEGKMLAILPDKTADAAVRALKKDRYGKGATRIGRVVRSPRGVWLKTAAGGLRPLQMLEGEQLPRIC